MSELKQPATANLTHCNSVASMAAAESSAAESWDPDRYAIALGENIRSSGMPLNLQRERLAALAGAGASAGQASADELARHFSILEALYHRFARAAVEAMDTGLPRASETADRYLSAALRAQRAAASCLSSLLILRDASRPPTTAKPESVAAPATSTTPVAK